MINQLKQRRTAVFLLAVLALVGGLVTGRSLLYNLAYLFGLLLITSFLWAWVNINGVHLSRVTRAQRTQVGRPLEERFTVRNTSIIPKLWLEVRDHSDVPGHQTSYVVNNLRPRQAFNWRTTTVCKERGRYQLGPITMRTSDPFGLFIMTKKLTPTSNVVIYPLTYDIQQFALPVGILPGGDALRRRTHYITTNASGVRDYAPGDSFSRIHWPSTARRNRMIVKEFELDPLADIWIILDMAAFGHIKSAESKSNSDNLIEDIPGWMRAENQFSLPETTEEYTVTAAASIAQYFIRSDRAVGMLAYGQSNELVQPDRGERQFTRILETLAVLRAQGHVPIDDMLHAESHLFPRGTTLIIVTPTNQEQWVTSARQLVRRGLRVVTILIDPESFGAKRTNAGLETMLHGNGMAAYRIRCGDDITAVLNQARSQSGYFIL